MVGLGVLCAWRTSRCRVALFCVTWHPTTRYLPAGIDLDLKSTRKGRFCLKSVARIFISGSGASSAGHIRALCSCQQQSEVHVQLSVVRT